MCIILKTTGEKISSNHEHLKNVLVNHIFLKKKENKLKPKAAVVA